MHVEYRTIPSWPEKETPRGERRSAHTFRASAFETQKLLAAEAQRIGAQSLVVEVVGAVELFYRDGTGIRSDRASKVGHVGVVVHLIRTRFGDLRYACDTYNGWEANLRAVALTLKALRDVDRYGAARRGEQYTGWAQLPPGTPLGAPAQREQMTLDEAARRLAAAVDGMTPAEILEDDAMARTAFRMAAKRLHPDNQHTGNVEAYALLDEAWQIVEKYHAG